MLLRRERSQSRSNFHLVLLHRVSFPFPLVTREITAVRDDERTWRTRHFVRGNHGKKAEFCRFERVPRDSEPEADSSCETARVDSFNSFSLSHSLTLALYLSLSLFLYIYTLFSSPKVSNKKRKLRNDILKPTRNYLSSLLLSFSFPRRNRSVFQQVANVQTLFTLVLSVLSLNASHEMSGAPHIRADSLN